MHLEYQNLLKKQIELQTELAKYSPDALNKAELTLANKLSANESYVPSSGVQKNGDLPKKLSPEARLVRLLWERDRVNTLLGAAASIWGQEALEPPPSGFWASVRRFFCRLFGIPTEPPLPSVEMMQFALQAAEPTLKLPALPTRKKGGAHRSRTRTATRSARQNEKPSQALQEMLNDMDTLDVGVLEVLREGITSTADRAYLDKLIQVAKESTQTQNAPQQPEKPEPSVEQLQLDVVEFTKNPALIDSVGMSNDPELLRSARTDTSLSPEDRAYLDTRIAGLEKIRALEENPPPKQLAGEPRIDPDGLIMLDNVTQPRPQRTSLGCWSVSLQSLLAYRGCHLNQEDIRAFRPDAEKQDYILPETTPQRLNSNSMQSIGDYANLIHRVLPNTAIHVVSHIPETDPSVTPAERMLLLQSAIKKGLQEHNSPVSIVYDGHFRTIMGIQGNTIFCKDPNSRDPNEIRRIDLSQAANARTGFQLYWLQDMAPRLDGSVPELAPEMGRGGTAFCGGQLINPGSLSPNCDSQRCMHAFVPTGSNRTFGVETYLPKQLSYSRQNPAENGFAVNMDAMRKNRDALQAVAGNDPQLQSICTRADNMVSGQERAGYDNLHALTTQYHQALQAAKAQLNTGTEAQQQSARQRYDTLMTQTQEMRQCLHSCLHAQNIRNVGDPSRFFSGVDQPQMQENFRTMQQGLAGILYDNMISAKHLDDAGWLQAMAPQQRNTGIRDLMETDAFKNMSSELLEKMQQETKNSVNISDRESYTLRTSALGGHPKELLALFNKHNQPAAPESGPVDTHSHQQPTNELQPKPPIN